MLLLLFLLRLLNRSCVFFIVVIVYNFRKYIFWAFVSHCLSFYWKVGFSFYHYSYCLYICSFVLFSFIFFRLVFFVRFFLFVGKHKKGIYCNSEVHRKLVPLKYNIFLFVAISCTYVPPAKYNIYFFIVELQNR